jgi:hypothetical protein
MKGLLPPAMMMYLRGRVDVAEIFLSAPLPHTQEYKPKKLSPSRSSIVA